MDSEYLHAVINLVIIMSLLFVLFFMIKKLKLSNKKTSQQINIINASSIGSKEKLLLIEVNQVMLLIGATPNHIETLYVFNPEEVEAVNAIKMDKTKQSESFSEHLSSVID